MNERSIPIIHGSVRNHDRYSYIPNPNGPHVQRFPQLAPGMKWMRFKIMGNTSGIDEATHKGIFRPFSTVENTDKGANLCLTMIISNYFTTKRLWGTLNVNSELDKEADIIIRH
jgi:hypothetical protein